MAQRKNVSATVVRNWLLSDEGQAALAAASVTTQVGKRGRHKPEQVAVFHKANPRMRYETASEAEKPTITVPVVMLDSIGRKTTKQVTVTTEYARTLLGHEAGRRGRFDKSLLSLALEAERLANA